MRKPCIRAAVVTAVIGGVIATATSPASALASVSVSGNCGYDQVCTAYAQSVPQVGTGSSVDVTCTAVTPYDVQATVVQCYILGNTGDVHWTPARVTTGRASTLVHTFDAWNLRSNVYRVCTGAGVFTTGGAYRDPANFACGSVV